MTNSVLHEGKKIKAELEKKINIFTIPTPEAPLALTGKTIVAFVHLWIMENKPIHWYEGSNKEVILCHGGISQTKSTSICMQYVI